METSIQLAFAVIVLLLVFAPVFLLIVAAIMVVQSMRDFSAIIIAVGAVLMAIASLDFLFNYIIALFYGPEELAAFALFAMFFFRGLNYLALMLIGAGLILFANRAKSVPN